MIPKELLFSLILILTLAASHFEKKNPYGLDIVADLKAYDSLIALDSNKKLLNVTDRIPEIQLDIRYATTNNFSGQQLYDTVLAFLRLPVLQALSKVQSDLRTMGLGLKIYDAYRPYSVTLHLYETYPDSTYVASPRKGSVHNTGSAVDISLIDLKTGEELAMPTEYDDFTEKAWPDYDQLPDSVKRNRDILISVMKKWGFEVYPSEWWHFNYKDWEVYHLMDLTFRELLRD